MALSVKTTTSRTKAASLYEFAQKQWQPYTRRGLTSWGAAALTAKDVEDVAQASCPMVAVVVDGKVNKQNLIGRLNKVIVQDDQVMNKWSRFRSYLNEELRQFVEIPNFDSGVCVVQESKPFSRFSMDALHKYCTDLTNEPIDARCGSSVRVRHPNDAFEPPQWRLYYFYVQDGDVTVLILRTCEAIGDTYTIESLLNAIYHNVDVFRKYNNNRETKTILKWVQDLLLSVFPIVYAVLSLIRILFRTEPETVLKDRFIFTHVDPPLALVDPPSPNRVRSSQARRTSLYRDFGGVDKTKKTRSIGYSVGNISTSRVNMLRDRYDASFDEFCLAIVAVTLRDFLIRHSLQPIPAKITAAIPIDSREIGDNAGQSLPFAVGRAKGFCLVDLPLDENLSFIGVLKGIQAHSNVVDKAFEARVQSWVMYFISQCLPTFLSKFVLAFVGTRISVVVALSRQVVGAKIDAALVRHRLSFISTAIPSVSCGFHISCAGDDVIFTVCLDDAVAGCDGSRHAIKSLIRQTWRAREEFGDDC